MFAEISSAISGAKGLLDLSNGVAALSTEHAVQKSAIELQGKVLALITQLVDIQARTLDLLRENENLKKEMAEFEQWDTEVVPRYQLIELARLVYAYKSVESPRNGEVEGNAEPEHYLCYGCFQKRRKSILQLSGYNSAGAILMCNECGVSIINHADKPSPWGSVSVPKTSKWDAFT